MNQREKKPFRVYIVDWDIPANDAVNHLRRICAKYEYDISTRSVLVTENRKFAREVYGLAKRHGEAHLYAARRLA